MAPKCTHLAIGTHAVMSALVTADFAQDIKTHLTELLQESGYVVDENQPESLTGITGEHLKYRSAWNIAYQFYNILNRSIQPRPRNVIWSQELSARSISTEFKTAIEFITTESEAGNNLTRFMSTRMEDASYTDELVNDWGIVHFHLGNPVPNKESLKKKLASFVRREDPLLFAYPTNATIYLIDMLSHGAWTEKNMIEIIHKQWPHIIAKYKQSQARAGRIVPDETMIKMLRRAGVSYPLVLSDGTVYLSPGGGYTSTRSSATAIDRANHLFNTLKPLDEYFRANAEDVLQKINKQLGTSISCLKLSLHYYHELDQFILLEMQTKGSLWQARF